MAHIHIAPPGVNGPIVEWLFPSTAPVAGHPLSELLAAMRNGGAYVNVQTNDGIPPTNTGPGDLPGGEIRGQLRAPGAP